MCLLSLARKPSSYGFINVSVPLEFAINACMRADKGVAVFESGSNVLAVDEEIGQLRGRLRVPHPEHAPDKLIAGTAPIQNEIVVMRNTATGMRLPTEITDALSGVNGTAASAYASPANGSASSVAATRSDLIPTCAPRPRLAHPQPSAAPPAAHESARPSRAAPRRAPSWASNRAASAPSKYRVGDAKDRRSAMA